jgi:sugar/nucleoside kinase (ribokinase family)
MREVGEKMLVTCVGSLVFDLFAIDLQRVSPPGIVTFALRGIETHVGGQAANVSINLRKLGLRKGEVSSVGAVGSDIFGNHIEETLEKQGVVANLQRVQGVETSKDLVLVVKGEDRRYHVDVGANLRLSKHFVLSVLSKEIPLVFYVGATGILGEFDTSLTQVFENAKSCNCITFADAVSPFQSEWEHLIRALEWTDIFHCNDVEAFGITGEKDPREAAMSLTRKGAKMVIISMGEKGLVARTEEITLEMPAFKMQVVDPSGAGDAFCAGLIRNLVRTPSRPSEMQEMSVEDICELLIEGAAAGAACVTGVGATTAVTHENIARLLKRQGPEVRRKTKTYSN